MKRLTASYVDHAVRCPGSLTLPIVRDEETSGQRDGNTRHRFLETVQAARNAGKADDDARTAGLDVVPDDDPMRETCEAIDVSQIPLGAVPEHSFWWHPETDEAGWLGGGLRRNYSEAPEGAIVATPDLCFDMSERGTVWTGDYKPAFNVLPAADSLQVATQGLCAARAAGVDSAMVSIIRVMPDGRLHPDHATLDAFALDAHAARLRGIIAAAQADPPEFRHGDWCGSCPSLTACPATWALVRATASDPPSSIRDVDSWLAQASPAEAGQAWAWLQRVMPALKALHSGLRTKLIHGPLPRPGGGLFVVRRQQVRKVANVAQAAEWLTTRGLGAAYIPRPPKITVASIEKAAKAQTADRKLRAAAARATVKDMEQAGFIVPSVRFIADEMDLIDEGDEE